MVDHDRRSLKNLEVSSKRGTLIPLVKRAWSFDTAFARVVGFDVAAGQRSGDANA